jgi:glycosyltransferase involved in cell wall biosynthesis
MLKQGSQLIFVKWNNNLDRLVLVSIENLSYLEQWGGPCLAESAKKANGYQLEGSEPQVIEGDDFNDCDWLIVPEVTHINYHQRQLTMDVILAAKRAHLRTAFIFYDAIPLRRPELAAMSSGHEAYMRQLLQADLILPISKWSSQDLQDFLKTHEGTLHNSLPTIETLLLPAQVSDQDRVQLISSHSKKRILCVGSIEERKNQVILAQAFNNLAQQRLTTDWQLIFIGNLNPALSEEFHELITTSRNAISWLGNCSDDELKKQYLDCSFTVFPSIEEGFGLPVAESLWMGKPCLCSNFGPMEETAEGGGCLMVDMRQQSAIEEGLQNLMHDTALRNKLSVEACTRTLQDWSAYGKDFIFTIKNTLSKTKLPAIYYLVDHTASFEKNTGIQRVVRGLAAGLLRQGVRLIPAKWNTNKTNLIKVDEHELLHLARWNGPPVHYLSNWSEPIHNRGAWLLMPELTPHFQSKDYKSIRGFLDLNCMRACVIFHDTTPWKLPDIYSQAATHGHRTYMQGLNRFELILPVSNYSREQLALFYQGEKFDTSGLANRLIANPLPGEFLETPRSLDIKPLHNNTIEVLSVGTLEPRKNHLILVEAFLRAASSSSRPMRLTLAGGGPVPVIAEKIQQLVQQHPKLLRWVVSPSDTVLNELYEQCDFTVYPSYEEGFGLPILESLWHARPCICMNQGAMAEVAGGGGCLTVNTCDVDALATLLVQLSENDALRIQLSQKATERSFKTWDDYAQDCAWLMLQNQDPPQLALNTKQNVLPWRDLRKRMPNLEKRPLLSVCISTYNRAKWLSLSLPVLIRETAELREHIEVLVCDNASTDTTSDVVAPYLAQGFVRYHRNQKNLGMLGNLRSTAQEACGQYVWILGDDDILKPGSVGRVIKALQQYPDLALVYLNYAFTREDCPKEMGQLQDFFASATPVVPACSDQLANIKELSVLNENFFTAIYCLVFQRSHALQAYSQFTEGEPFSSLPTCVPTTNYVLHHMMNLKGYWLGEPQLIVNLNVSWMRYAWRWILERLPEIHDLAIKKGSDRLQVDHLRSRNLPSIVHFLKEIYSVNAIDPIRISFDMAYLISQIKHLNEYSSYQTDIMKIYSDAFSVSHPLAKRSPNTIFINNQTTKRN